MIFVDPSDGLLAVRDSYDDRSECQSAGCFWDADSKLWKMVFTLKTFETLLKKIPNAFIDPSMKKSLEEQKKKEDKLEEIRKMAKEDQDVSFRVTGLNATLYPYQKIGILYATVNRSGLLIGDEMGLGKGHVHGTMIYTPTGKIPVEKLRIGDQIIGRNGNPVNVIGVYPKPKQDIFRVTLNDGFYLDVDIDHLWYVQSAFQLNAADTEGVVLSVKQLMEPSGVLIRKGKGFNSQKDYEFATYFKTRRGNNRWSIPVTSSIQFKSQTVPLDPYLLGVFLGDGRINDYGSVILTMLKADARDVLSEFLCTFHKTEKPHLEIRYYGNYKKQLRSLNLNGKHSYDKFIPIEYKYNTQEVRLSVLQGLMDTDGNASDFSTEYSTCSKQLCEDVVEIVQSLGGIARIRSRIPAYFYKGEKKTGRLSYRVNIKLPPAMIPFRLKRKILQYDIPSKYCPARYISNIEKLPDQAETICIAVDAEDHLYVAEHGIVTHNTIQGLATALVLKNKGLIKDCLIITPASLKYNWPLEIAKFTNEKCIVIDAKKPDDRIPQWLDNSCFFKIANYELIVGDLFGGKEYKEKKGEALVDAKRRMLKKAKQDIRQRILSDIRERIWDLVILDEIHFIKHNTSLRFKAVKALKAKVKIGLSGTPMDGKLEELYTIMNVLAPGALGSRTSFFTKHVVLDFFGAIKGYKNIQEVQEKIAPFFIRRLKKNILKQLPDKIFENKIIALSEEEKRIYGEIKKGKHECVKDAEAIVRAIRCKQFCNFPQMLVPTCKASSKLDAFRDAIEEVIQLNGNKAVIFSQYKEMVNVLVTVLKDLHIKFLRIDGDTDKKLRADYQKRFNEDNTIDCIIGTEAMSTGLNLTGANFVFSYDDNWQPAIMAQRVDRCHRIGQKDTVTCISFICKDTIEEHIRSVLYSKDKITSETLGDGTEESVLKKLGTRELEDLM